MYETPNYEIAYFLMIGSLFFICYPPANVTVLIMIVSGYTESQMLALSEELLHLWDDATTHYNKTVAINHANYTIDELSKKRNVMVNEYIKYRLKEITKIHALNINLFSQVESVFRGAIAMGYLFIILGLIAELLGGLENTYLQMPYAFIQLSIVCYTGQKVIDASLIYEAAVYACKWENFDRANMKTVLLILQNSQKTLTLSAGGVTVLSFSCLMSVFKSIYSAYTTLRTTMNKP